MTIITRLVDTQGLVRRKIRESGRFHLNSNVLADWVCAVTRGHQNYFQSTYELDWTRLVSSQASDWPVDTTWIIISEKLPQENGRGGNCRC